MEYPFITTPRPLRRRYPTTNLRVAIAAVVTIFVVDELDVRLCVQNRTLWPQGFSGRDPPALSRAFLYALL